MDVLEAHFHFCALSTDQQVDLMPLDADTGATGPTGDPELIAAYPLWLTAGAVLSGMLDECRNVTDLVEAFKHFVSLWDGELEAVSSEAWTAAATDVLGALEESALRFGMALGNHLSRNAAFSQAELN